MRLLMPLAAKTTGIDYRRLNGVCGSGSFLYPATTAQLNSELVSNVVTTSLPALTTTSQVNSFLHSQGFKFPGKYSPQDLTIYADGVLPLLKRVELDEKIEAQGTYKEFEQQRRDGVIVLKPLHKVKASVSDKYLYDAVPNGAGSSAVNTYFNWPKEISEPFRSSDPRACNWSGRSVEIDFLDYGVATVIDVSVPAYAEYPFAGVYWQVMDGTVTTLFERFGKPDLEALSSYIAALDVPPGLINPALDEVHSGAYDILTEIGESKETIGYLFGILKRIVRLALSFKSKEQAARRKLKGKDLVDEVTSLWMQFRYAVSPLAYSFKDAADYLSAKTLQEYVTARKRRDVDCEVDLHGWKYTFTVEHRVFAKARIDLSATTAQLGVNPLKTLGELAPLAFVVNWVFPIGQMLGALLPPPSALQIAATHSKRVRSVKAEKDGQVLMIDFDLYNNKVIPATAEFNLRPDFYFNWKRGLDAFALSWSMFLKRLWK